MRILVLDAHPDKGRTLLAPMKDATDSQPRERLQRIEQMLRTSHKLSRTPHPHCGMPNLPIAQPERLRLTEARFYFTLLAVWSAKTVHFPSAFFCSSRKRHILLSGFHINVL